jgi:NADH-quinone oxidoreductase subunit H
MLCMQAKLTLIPFDMPEAECEIQAGVFVEYSGPPLALLFLTRTMMTALMPVFLIVLFFGGLVATGLNWLWGGLLYVGIIVVTILLRNTNPRIRIDQAMRLFWFTATPVAAIALALAILGW